MKSCQKGRSMIEMLGVLAIVGVLSVGGIAGYSKAMKKIRSEKTTSQINEVVMNIRNLYIHQDGYKGISAQILINTNLIPIEMFDPNISSNQELKNAFGGSVLIFESKDITEAPRAFEIYATGLDKELCIMMSTLDWGSDPSAGFEALYVGTQIPETAILQDIHVPTDSIPENGIFTPGMHTNAIPLTVPTAMSVCSCSQNECVIGLKYT